MKEPFLSGDVEVEETSEGTRYVPIIRFGGVAYHEIARARAFAADVAKVLGVVLSLRAKRLEGSL